MNALFITSENQYSVVSHFIQGMCEDLLALGVQSHTVNVSNLETADQQLLPLSHYQLLVSFNGVGLTLSVDGESIDSYMQQKPVFIFTVDHPIHLMYRFLGRNVIVLCVDQEHVAFCQLCGLQAVYFPHATSLQKLQQLDLVAPEDKTDEILFPVSYFDESHWRQKLEPVWHQVGHIIEQANTITRFMQFISVLPLGDKPAQTQLDANIRQVCMFTDYYLRAKRRKECLLAFAEAGVKLTVIGNDVENYKSCTDFHDYQPAMEFEQLALRISQAKYVAHNTPGFELGLHERLIEPLAHGTLVCAYHLPFAVKAFSTSQGVVGIQDLPDISLDSYRQRQSAAQQQILQQHTWQHRWSGLLGQLGIKHT